MEKDIEVLKEKALLIDLIMCTNRKLFDTDAKKLMVKIAEFCNERYKQKKKKGV